MTQTNLEKLSKHELITLVEELQTSAQTVSNVKLERDKLLQVVDNIPNAYITIVENDLSVGLTSGGEFKKLGLDPNQFIGLSIEDVFGDQTPFVKAKYLKAFKGEKQTFNLFINEQHQLYEVIPLKDQKSKINQILVFVRNITAQKEAENILLEREELFRSLFEQDILVNLIVNPNDGALIDANTAAVNFYGWPREQLLQMTIHEINTLSQEEVAHEMKKAKDKQQNHFEFQHRLSDGSIRDVDVFSSSIVLHGRQLLYSSIYDITEQKQAELERIRSQEKFQTMVENSPLAIVMSRGVEQITEYLNPTFTALLGYTIDDVPSVSKWWPLAYPDKEYRKQIEELWQKKVERAIESDSQIEPMETIVSCKDGSTRNILWGFVSTDNQNWSFGQDLTSIRMAEKELSDHRANLEILVAERTAQLQKNYLELANKQKEVETASQLKSEFLSNMSHELRTPLSSILSLSHVLANQAKDRLNDEEIKYLEIVERNGKNLLSLVNDILDLSRIEAGKTELFFSKVSFCQLAEVIQSNLLPLAEEKGLTVDVIASDDIPLVTSDEQKLHQALTNIAGNAIKFTESGSIKITITHDDHFVYTDIEDTGIGISVEALPHIFDEFRQVDGSFSRKYEGTGLGLAIAYRTINLLGGTIRVKSELGVGSRFTVSIPIHWVDQSEITLAPEEDDLIIEGAEEFSRLEDETKNILVIEDNPDNMVTVKALLGGKFDILEAVDGKSGLDLAIKRSPDLILLDMILPEMSGIEVAKRLKSNNETQNIPVIALSASVMSHNKKSFLEAGCDAFVPKPIDQKVLFATIEKWLKK